jgi:hypothetical protein
LNAPFLQLQEQIARGKILEPTTIIPPLPGFTELTRQPFATPLRMASIQPRHFLHLKMAALNRYVRFHPALLPPEKLVLQRKLPTTALGNIRGYRGIFVEYRGISAELK